MLPVILPGALPGFESPESTGGPGKGPGRASKERIWKRFALAF